MASGSAVLSLLIAQSLRALLIALSLRLALSLTLARRGLVGRVARWHGSAGADRSAGSHPLPRHAFAGRAGVAGRRAGVAGRRAGVAGRRADMAGSWALARRHRLVGPRRLSGPHGITGWHGITGCHGITGWHGWRRLAAGGMRCPAGTAGAHPWLVARTRRLSSGPAR